MKTNESYMILHVCLSRSLGSKLRRRWRKEVKWSRVKWNTAQLNDEWIVNNGNPMRTLTAKTTTQIVTLPLYTVYNYTSCIEYFMSLFERTTEYVLMELILVNQLKALAAEVKCSKFMQSKIITLKLIVEICLTIKTYIFLKYRKYLYRTYLSRIFSSYSVRFNVFNE